jgi:hypothetical protein
VRQSSTSAPAPGEPGTRIQQAGLSTYAIDASSAMVAAFRERFPGMPIKQNTAEASELFDRTFDGVLAWALLLLLEPKLKRSSSRRWRARSTPEGVSSSRPRKSPSNGWMP